MEFLMTGNNLHVFIRGKVLLTNLIGICDEMAALVEKVSLVASKTFDTVTISILTLVRYGFD